MANASAITVQALGAVSAGDFTGAAVDLGEGRTAAKLRCRITACTDTIQIALETSDDGSTGWRDGGQVVAFANAPAKTEIVLTGLDRYVRAVGSAAASTTFELTGEAHQLYADEEDLTSKISIELVRRLQTVEADAVARALLTASAEMESALAVQHPLPLTTVPEIVRDKTADLAAYRVIGRLIAASRGNACAAPGEQITAMTADNNKQAMAWLESARKRYVLPYGAVPAANDPHKTSSGDPNYPDTYPPRFTNNWGDFG